MMSEHPLKARIVALRKAGHSYGVIARTLGCTRSVVAGVLHRVGLKTGRADGRPVNRHASPFPASARAEAVRRSYREGVKAVASEFGVDPSTLYDWRKEPAA